MVKKFSDFKMLVIVYEMMVDINMVKEDYERVIENYNQMLNFCIRIDYRVKLMVFCKMGNVYRDLKKD